MVETKRIINYTTGALFALTLLSGFILSSPLASADNSATNNVEIAVPISCNLASSTTTAHTATIDAGTYRNDIGESTITATCNDSGGFAIYAIGYSNDTHGNNTLINTTNENQTIASGTATSGATSNWAMKLTAVTGTYEPTIESAFESYTTIPITYTKVASMNSTTDQTTGAQLKSTYAAYIAPTQYAGTYRGKVKYTLVHPHDSAAPRPTLYMQKVNEWANTIAAEEEVTAIDSRDGKSYTVARLADGNLWMTQNLDHDIVIDGSVIYDNTTTDLGWNDSTGSYTTANWTPSTATYETSVTTWNWSNTIPESYDPGELYWTGVIRPDNRASCEAVGGVWNTDGSYYYCTNHDLIFISSTGDSHYHLGNYYNWTAAVAMNDSSSYDTDGEIIDQSLCPAGWTLPKSGSITTNGSFQYLIEQYGWDSNSLTMDNPTIWNSPIKTPLSGDWGGQMYYVGSEGTFFSPIVRGLGGTYTDGLTIFSLGGVKTDYQVLRVGGNSIRCISRY